MNINIACDSIQAQLVAVKSGIGFSILPYSCVRNDIDKGNIYALDVVEFPQKWRTVSIIWMREIPLSNAAKVLMKMIEEEGKIYKEELNTLKKLEIYGNN
jgi:DNA-binding transcriptional LysR family regulator